MLRDVTVILIALHVAGHKGVSVTDLLIWIGLTVLGVVLKVWREDVRRSRE